MTKKKKKKNSVHAAHAHPHTDDGVPERLQLRAATAGACCWSVDWSCRPRYSLQGTKKKQTIK